MYSDQYCNFQADFLVFHKGDKVGKLFMLIQGTVRLFKEDDHSPMVSAINILNGEILDAITSIPVEFSSFVVGKAHFLTLDLKTFLKLKRKFKGKKVRRDY